MSFRRAGRLPTLLAVVAVVLVVVVAGYGITSYLAHRATETELVIYTYPSIFGGVGTDCVSPVLSQLLAPFESEHHVQIELECPTGTLVSTLLAEKGSPRADLVVGLDEVTAPQAEANGLLIPYAPADLSNVNPDLVRELSPDHGATPYEWGYLGIDYNDSFNAASGGAIARSAFPGFAANVTWAHNLLVEDPTTDITGEEFLLWEIEFYSSVLHQNWQDWWQAVGPSLQFAPDWGTALTEFTAGTGNPPMAVSYTTDPAYAAANGAAGQYNSTVTTWNGTEYGWRTVYGMGIVAGTSHLSLDQELVDWFLNGTVQSAVPTNEWEYPANQTVTVPAVFNANPNPTPIVALDDRTTPAEIAANLTGYLDTWQNLANGWT